jgi:hypothetical protein
VSKHLRVLRKVGLVDVRDAGRQRVYRLNGYPLKLIHDWVKNYERSWSQRFDRLDAVLAELREEERIVSTEIFEAMPDADALVTATFTEKGRPHDPRHAGPARHPGAARRAHQLRHGRRHAGSDGPP